MEVLESKLQRQLYVLLVVASVIVAFPSTMLYYIAPLFVLGYSFRNSLFINARTFLLIIVSLLLLTLFSYGLEVFQGHRINFSGVLFSLIMYMPILILLSSDTSVPITEKVSQTVVRYIAYFTIFQSVICFLQAGIGGLESGDVISGTYGLLSFLTTVTIAQVMYAFNTFVIIFFLIAYLKSTFVKVAIGLSVLAVAMSQSGHQTLFFLVALFIVYVRFSQLKVLLSTLFSIGVVVLLVDLFFPESISIGLSWYERLFILADLPKVSITIESVHLLGSAKILLLGTGLAQFCSRAALFLSGDYISGSLPAVLLGQSYYYAKFVDPEMTLHRLAESPSAIATPNYSILSVLMELGVIVFLLLGILGIREYRRNNKIASVSKNKEVIYLAKFINATLVFTLLSSFVENYLEFVQATVIPVLLVIIARSRMAYLVKEGER